MKTNEEYKKIISDPNNNSLIEEHKKISKALYYLSHNFTMKIDQNKKVNYDIISDLEEPGESEREFIYFDKKYNPYIKYDYYDLVDLHNQLKNTNHVYNILCRYNNNLAKRKKRLFERVNDFTMLINDIIGLSYINNYELYFCTFTLDDNHYNRYKNNINNFLRYIKKLLNNLNASYVINTDFGDKKDRLHAHGLIALPKGQIINIDQHNYIMNIENNYNLGFYNLESFYNSDLDKKQVSEYIIKVVRHTFKETNKNAKIVYSNNYNELINIAIIENNKTLKELDKINDYINSHTGTFANYLFDNKIDQYKKSIHDKISYLNNLVI